MTALDDLERRYNGPMPERALREATDGLYAHELYRAGGMKWFHIKRAAQTKDMIRRERPSGSEARDRGFLLQALDDLRHHATAAVKWDKNHRELVAMRRAARTRQQAAE